MSICGTDPLQPAMARGFYVDCARSLVVLCADTRAGLVFRANDNVFNDEHAPPATAQRRETAVLLGREFGTRAVALTIRAVAHRVRSTIHEDRPCSDLLTGGVEVLAQGTPVLPAAGPEPGARSSVPAADASFDVRDYGARGDGIALDTEAIDRAMVACSVRGVGPEEAIGVPYDANCVIHNKDVCTSFPAPKTQCKVSPAPSRSNNHQRIRLPVVDALESYLPSHAPTVATPRRSPRSIWPLVWGEDYRDCVENVTGRSESLAPPSCTTTIRARYHGDKGNRSICLGLFQPASDVSSRRVCACKGSRAGYGSAMSKPGEAEFPTPSGEACFATTHWSVVLAAGQKDTLESVAALETLCRAYWGPVHAYLQRRGCSFHDAQDITQEFFAQLLRKNYPARVDRTKGKFRTFLLHALNQFLTDYRKRAHALKRGGNQAFISFDEPPVGDGRQLEVADELTPEKLFERRWAQTVLDRALARLREEFLADGKQAMYEVLRSFEPGEQKEFSYEEAAGRLNVSESAVKSMIHRLRRRHRELVRDEIAQTVPTVADIDDELRHLVSALRD